MSVKNPAEKRTAEPRFERAQPFGPAAANVIKSVLTRGLTFND